MSLTKVPELGNKLHQFRHTLVYTLNAYVCLHLHHGKMSWLKEVKKKNYEV